MTWKYKEREIECTFIEIIEPDNKNNKIIGCIYKHPNVPVTEFTNDYMSPILEKFSHKKKEIILMGDFNINILTCESHKDAEDFVDTIYASSLYPTISNQTQFTASKPLDNSSYNGFSKKKNMAGNIANFYL